MIVSRIVETSERISGETVRFEKKDYTPGTEARPDSDSKATAFHYAADAVRCSLADAVRRKRSPPNCWQNSCSAWRSIWPPSLPGSRPVMGRRLFVDGLYRTLAWVVSVMLPPMAIFSRCLRCWRIPDTCRASRLISIIFPKGLCPWKQALTMCMGFGCNAAGVIGCRIIDSPRNG